MNMDHPPSQYSSPVRRRGKRRHSPIRSPQPEEKRATTDNVASEDTTVVPDPVDEECPWSRIPAEHPTGEREDTESRPESVLLPQDSDEEDDGDNDEDLESDMDNETTKNTDVDGDNDTGHGLHEIHDNDDNDDNDDDDEDNDSQHSDEDPMDPAEYLDLVEDEYPSDDGASFATVSEAELPNSPTPHPVRLSLKKGTRTEKRNETAGAVAQDADALFKLAAVLPTQGGSPS